MLTFGDSYQLNSLSPPFYSYLGAKKGVNDSTLYIEVTPFATIAEGVAPFAIITVRGNVYIRVGVVGYGTIAKESNTQRYTKRLTAVPYIRRLSVSTYISENATVVTYKKEAATVGTLFSNTEQRVHILADGCPLRLYKRLKPSTIYLGGSTPLLYIREVHTLAIHIYPRTPTNKAKKTKNKKGDRKNEFCKVF